MKNKCALSVNVLIILMIVSSVFAQNRISYQGKLLENQEPVTLTKTMTFTIGSWEETQDVVIEDGLYAITLGEVVSIPDEIFKDDNLILEISIEGNLIETAILPVPVAIRAKNADNSEKIAGTPVTGIPETDQILKYDGTSWVPSTDEIGNQAETDPVWSNASSNYYQKNELETIATTGSYSDLKDKPAIAYDSSIPADQLTQGEVSNIKTNKLADGSTPWNSNTVDSSRVTGLSTVAKTGNYNDLTNKPSSIAADDFLQTEVNNVRSNKLANGTTPWDSNTISSSRVSGLHSVATTGNYNNLSNKPSIAYSSSIAADDLTQSQVDNIKNNLLANGTAPWSNSSGLEFDSGVDAIGVGESSKYIYHDLGRIPRFVEITMSFNRRTCVSKWMDKDGDGKGDLISFYEDDSDSVESLLIPNTTKICRDNPGSSSVQDFEISTYSNKIKIKRGYTKNYSIPNITEIGWIVY